MLDQRDLELLEVRADGRHKELLALVLETRRDIKLLKEETIYVLRQLLHQKQKPKVPRWSIRI